MIMIMDITVIVMIIIVTLIVFLSPPQRCTCEGAHCAMSATVVHGLLALPDRVYVCMCTYIYIYVYVYIGRNIYIYIYIYIVAGLLQCR